MSITTPVAWDGWPDGELRCLFSAQEVADTSQLEINWVCEPLPGHRGSTTAATWQKGKEIQRQCVGVLECSSQSCSLEMQIAPAVRGIDRHRQLQNRCLCGDRLLLRQCGVKASIHFFQDGAHFSNSGLHTHSRLTHTLICRPHQPLVFSPFIARRPVSLDESPDLDVRGSS